MLVQFSRSVVSDSLWPHGLQHSRLPCLSPTPEACSNSCPLSQWSHPTILSSVVPFCPQIFPSIRVFSSESVFHIRWPTYWSFSFSISPSNEYSGLISFRIDWLDLLTVQGILKSLLQHHSSNAWLLLRLPGLISLLSKRLSRVFSNITIKKHQLFSTQPSLWSNSHIHSWLLEKPQLWLYGPLSAKWLRKSWQKSQ